MKDDKYYLKIATEEGNKKSKPYNFGAVVVKDGEIVAREHNLVHENNDPSAHAEVTAIKSAAVRLGDHNIPGCTLYASHEPCVMCFCCAAWAEIDRIVYAVPASAKGVDSYEFTGVSLNDLAAKLNRGIIVDQIEP